MSVPTTIHRTDPLPVFANPGKAQAVRRLLDTWRDAAGAVAADQWRRFYQDGGFQKHLSANAEAADPAVRAAKVSRDDYDDRFRDNKDGRRV
jgi:hypothetical protein